MYDRASKAGSFVSQECARWRKIQPHLVDKMITLVMGDKEREALLKIMGNLYPFAEASMISASAILEAERVVREAAGMAAEPLRYLDERLSLAARGYAEVVFTLVRDHDGRIRVRNAFHIALEAINAELAVPH